MEQYIWMPKKEMELRQKAVDNFWKDVTWGNSTKREPKEDDNVKLAWVYIEDRRVMLGVDNKTMKGYAMRDDVPVWKTPLEPQEYDRFERWCTTFDV